MNVLADLYLTFFRIGAFTFGGGYAMLPLLEREVVTRKGWVTNAELTDYFAIGQCTPGIIAVDTAALVGYKTGGPFGGTIAVLGIVTPSVLLICAIAGVLREMTELAWVAHAFAGIRAGVVALILSVLVRLVREAVTGVLPAVLFAVVLIGAAFLGLPPALLVILVGLFGYVRARFGGKKA